MSIWRKQGGLIGKQGGNDYPSSGLWDVTETYTDANVLPPAVGEFQYTTTGSHAFTVPAQCNSVSVVCIGGGGGGMYYNNNSSTYSYRMNGGGGGGLVYVPAISVTPGQVITVIVATGGQSGAYSTGSTVGGNSSFGTLSATGGNPGRYNQNITGGGGFAPFAGGIIRFGGSSEGTGASVYGPAGGGGAAGYTSNGGIGWNRASGQPSYSGDGGGGGGWSTSFYESYGGGGVGIFGAGSNGTQGGANVQAGSGSGGTNPTSNQVGGLYGGGGGGNSSVFSGTGGNGGQGAVRIIFGPGRAFPSTNTDLASSNGNVTIV